MAGSQIQQRVKTPVPLYAKVGWVVAWTAMLVVVAMMLRNCATSVIYGSKTDKAQVDSLYQAGLQDGATGQGPAVPREAVENPVLRKSYNKGYRDGVDRRRSHEPATTTEHPQGSTGTETPPGK